MANTTYPVVRHVVVSNQLVARWDTVIGKDVIMAITGVDMILFWGRAHDRQSQDIRRLDHDRHGIEI